VGFVARPAPINVFPRNRAEKHALKCIHGTRELSQTGTYT